MAEVQAFQTPGLKLWFYSNDHEPPHFHAKRVGEWEVRVRFLEAAAQMIEVKWQATAPSAKVLKILTSLAEQHRDELLVEWEAVHA
jgi:hypothetical protein